MTSASGNKSLKVLFVPLDSHGHINACVGIAQKIVAHGHRAIFALEQWWKGKVSRFDGLEEVIYVDKTRPEAGRDSNEYWLSFMEHYKAVFPLEPMEALKHIDLELEEKFLYNFFNVHDELKRIIEHEVKPDVIVVDTYVTIPAVLQSDIPWVWVTSAQPLCCLPHPDLPPARSGYPTNGDRAKWKEFQDLIGQLYGKVIERFNKHIVDFGLEPAPEGFCHPSPYLNMYAYPEELDYLDIRPLPEKWRRFDHFIRTQSTDSSSFAIPHKFLNTNQGKLIYISMGSLGCADVELAKRLVAILANSPHKFIYSLGPFCKQVNPLPANVWGVESVPQTQVLSLVDLMISHGGNNSILEGLYNGLPMIVAPLFDDQRDNAQRISELGLGRRINPYTVTEEQLLSAIEEMLANNELRQRLKTISIRMQASNSTDQAARAIESLVN